MTPSCTASYLLLSTTSATIPLSQLGPLFTSLHLNENEHNHDGFIPLALTLDLSVNIFNRARIDVLRAEILVRSFLHAKEQLIPVRTVCFCLSASVLSLLRAGSVVSVLHNTLPVTMQLTCCRSGRQTLASPAGVLSCRLCPIFLQW